jgi:hypothetical protein
MTRAYNTATTQQNSGGAVAPMTAGKNAIINGGFDIWQRGTSVSYSASGTPYGPDRLTIYGANTGTCSRQVTNDTTNLPNIQYSARTQRTAGGTSTFAFYTGQSIETINSIPFAGKTVTFSYYVRVGANFSGTNLTTIFRQGTGTDQNFVTGAITGETTLLNTNIFSSLTTTWQRFTHTFTITSAATELGFYFYWGPSGTAGANDWYEVTGIQLEVGSVATPFSRAGGTIAGELAACQRYYSRVNGTTVGGATWINGHITGSSPAYAIACYQYPVEMRVAPTITQSGSVRVSSASTLNDFSSFAGGAAVKSLRTLYTPTGVTNGYACHIDFLSTAFIEMSAEL